MKQFLLLFFISCNVFYILSAQMIITGVFDGPLQGGTPKGVELYVTDDIPDLSIWGLGSANNGGGTDSVEFAFAGGSANAGDYIYVTNDSLQFIAFFGFNPTNASGAMAINGDDAIELFNNGQVVDIYGDVNVDGTGQVWEYLDGWAVRNAGSGPDGTTFVPGNWTYSGINELEGGMTNDACNKPFPLENYTGGQGPDVIIEARSNFTFAPADITIDVGDMVEWRNTGGFHNVNGSLAAYPDNPEGFDNGGPSTDAWTYRFTFTKAGVYNYHCDPHLSLGMTGRVTVMGEVITFPSYPISVVTTENSDGVADSLGVRCEIQGRVYGPNFRPSGLQIFILDENNNGIGLFTSSDQFGTYSEGDVISVKGTIGQFNGLTQILPQEITPLAQMMDPVDPLIVMTALGEDTESKLIRINDLVVDEVGNDGNSGFNVMMHNANADYVIRVDADTDIPHPMFAVNQRYHVTGLGSQFDSSDPRTEGYQVLPRSMDDLELITAVKQVDFSDEILVYPTMVHDMVYFDTDLDLDGLVVTDAQGKLMTNLQKKEIRDRIDITLYPSGLYFIRFYVNDQSWTTRFVKE